MKPAVSNTRQRILDAGLCLLTQEGLSGVTLGRLAERVDLSKSGLFAHFRSKEDLQVALLEHTAQFAQSCIVEPAFREPEGLPRLRALVQGWFGWTERAGLPGGCPIAAGIFELDDMEGPVRDKLLAMENQWTDLLGQVVRRAIGLKHLRPGVDADQFVWELCGIYLARHTTQRFQRDGRADQRAAVAFQALLDRAKPEKTKRH